MPLSEHWIHAIDKYDMESNIAATESELNIKLNRIHKRAEDDPRLIWYPG